MNSHERRHHILLVLCMACIYFLADLPVQLTGFLQYDSFIGIKNFLPTTLGLLFGPYGVLGSIIGCTATAAILRTPISFMLLEWLCIALPGFGIWLLWHLGSTTPRIRFKRVSSYFRYIGILLVLHAICGGLSNFFIDGGAFREIMISYVSLSILVGIPINILFNGVLCLDLVLPPTYYLANSADSITIQPKEAAIKDLQDFLDSISQEKLIASVKKAEYQSTLEEIFLRILKIKPTDSIHVQIGLTNIMSAVFTYEGPSVNPMLPRDDDDEIDKAGLALFRHRTLHTNYLHRGGMNIIHFLTTDGLVAMLTNDAESLEQFNGQLEDYATSLNIGRKQLFALQNCLEELYIRICKAIPDVKLTIQVTYDDTFSIQLSYAERPFNPLIIGKEEDEMDIASLKLIKHRALRASYKYKYAENLVHIVI
ncbi:MAG: hypothetical protein IKX30_09845 [Victivallales bacterium]|nr:hypothetical protein [Victivallales bacterium]